MIYKLKKKIVNNLIMDKEVPLLKKFDGNNIFIIKVEVSNLLTGSYILGFTATLNISSVGTRRRLLQNNPNSAVYL